MPADMDDTDRAGVYLSGYRVTRNVGIFREQTTSDYGVDAQVEFKDSGVPTGHLVGLQIKTGPSYFDEPTPEGDGWRFRPLPKHVTYWVGHSLPMYILLVDLDEEAIYWQELSERTFETGPQGGLFVKVPRHQSIETARPLWVALADGAAENALALYDDNLTRLSPQTVKIVRRLADVEPNTAALLASRFARGRSAPELVVRSLLDSEPPWLSAAGAGEGLAAVAEYAHSHGLIPLAVQALLTAAERDPSQAVKRFRVAGLLLMDLERDRSRQLLNEAYELPGGTEDLHIAVGLVVAQHPEGDAAPVTIPPELEARITAATDDEFVLAFRATRAQRLGDMETAVSLFEAAVAIEPDSAALMVALAESLARRSRTATGRPTDQEASITWASKALDQLHEWNGPTEGALSALLQAQMSAGRFAGALDRSLSSPDGTATTEESRRPSVQATAAVAAYALDRQDIATRVLESMPEGLDRDFARARMRLGSDEEQRADWVSLVDRLDETRPEALLTAVMRLAELGVDRSDRLDSLVARHMVPASMQALAAASAAAVGDLDGALPRLRVLAEADESSAFQLLGHLMHAQRYLDAEVAAAAAYARFRAVEFALFRVEALDRVGRNSDVEELLVDVLANPNLDPLNRQVADRRLAMVLATRTTQSDEQDSAQLWRRVEGLMSDSIYVEGAPVQDQDVWMLVEAKSRLGNYAAAWTFLGEHDPAISTIGEARLWLSAAQQQQVLSANDYRRMLDLADEFATNAQLSAALLTTVITRTRDEEDEPASTVDQRPVLEHNLRAQAFAQLQEHIERHGDETPVRVLAGDTPEALVAQMTAMMRRDNQPFVEAVEMVRQARLPFGFLSLMARRPYSSTLAERPLGYSLASAAIAEDDEADEVAAAGAIGDEVVIDASTLLVVTEINEYDKLRGQFRGLLMPAVALADIVRGRSDLDGRASSSGFLSFDSEADSLVASELDVEELLATLRRFGQMEDAAKSPVPVLNVSLDEMSEISTDESAPWLAPIALAKERGIALWSDDLAQRRLARVFGVPAFGTTTLQQLRTSRALEQEAMTETDVSGVMNARRAEVLTLLAKRVVDVPTDVETVIEAARAEEWNERIALVTIGRPGWWHMAVNPFADVQQILREADVQVAEVWRYHAMWGVVRVAAGEPSRQATLLAACALLALTPTPDIEASLKYLHAANNIAAQRDAHTPTDYLYEAVATLVTAGVLDSSSDLVSAIRERLDGPPPADTSQGEGDAADDQ